MCLEDCCKYVELIELPNGNKRITHYKILNEGLSSQKFSPFYAELWVKGLDEPLKRYKFKVNTYMPYNGGNY